MHTVRLQRLGAPPEVVAALREGHPIGEPALESIRTSRSGAGGDRRRERRAGYTTQNSLEVVLGIGAYTMSTLANRMTRAPLDPALQPFAWSPHAA